ncbi:uncharacterized protein ARMOST_06105 [Armillaria ostoyae]|uniref:Heterokaryon incompatibility domain-containing protein n=1 Tax=Armillaria ostoyae TaxID=47428 RepID=A0A284R225_ARMOS|nr:uncharacterized protein ARMOST_06105 [Armillaria ostoyae]
MTPINGYEWPVPMPKDANLDLIRIEMLNLGAQYAWLDVLCLRQEGGKGEHLRIEEWKVDVPTIGCVYDRALHVVCYFNGLDRALHLTSDYFDSDRCWFRRAWTLQEIVVHPIIGGETSHNIMEKEVRRRFGKQLKALREMRDYDKPFPLDKVAGLVHLFKTYRIPIYNAEQSAADMWEVLMDVMDTSKRAELFFYYPRPGAGKKYWRPSWQQLQVMATTINVSELPGSVGWTDDPDVDCYEGYHVESGKVQGLGEVPKEKDDAKSYRQGELVLKDATGASHTLKIVANHTYQIPDGLYTVIGCDRWLFNDIWVVGSQREDGRFQKFSVFRSATDEKVKLRALALENVQFCFLK